MWRIVFVIILDIISVFLSIRNFSDRPSYRWALNPFFFIPWTLFVCIMIGGMAASWGGDGITGFGLSMLFCIFLAAPQGLLTTAFVSHHLSHIFTFGSTRGIVNLKTCDQALAAEKQERFAEAEAIFQQTLAPETEEEDQKKRALYAPVHLSYGNFLQRRGRLKDAIREWQIAMQGNIMPSQYLVTAMRTTDVLLQKKDPQAAAMILRQAIEKYPKENETRVLRERLTKITRDS